MLSPHTAPAAAAAAASAAAMLSTAATNTSIQAPKTAQTTQSSASASASSSKSPVVLLGGVLNALGNDPQQQERAVRLALLSLDGDGDAFFALMDKRSGRSGASDDASTETNAGDDSSQGSQGEATSSHNHSNHSYHCSPPSSLINNPASSLDYDYENTGGEDDGDSTVMVETVRRLMDCDPLLLADWLRFKQLQDMAIMETIGRGGDTEMGVTEEGVVDFDSNKTSTSQPHHQQPSHSSSSSSFNMGPADIHYHFMSSASSSSSSSSSSTSSPYTHIDHMRIMMMMDQYDKYHRLQQPEQHQGDEVEMQCLSSTTTTTTTTTTATTATTTSDSPSRHLVASSFARLNADNSPIHFPALSSSVSDLTATTKIVESRFPPLHKDDHVIIDIPSTSTASTADQLLAPVTTTATTTTTTSQDAIPIIISNNDSNNTNPSVTTTKKKKNKKKKKKKKRAKKRPQESAPLLPSSSSSIQDKITTTAKGLELSPFWKNSGDEKDDKPDYHGNNNNNMNKELYQDASDDETSSSSSSSSSSASSSQSLDNRIRTYRQAGAPQNDISIIDIEEDTVTTATTTAASPSKNNTTFSKNEYNIDDGDVVEEENNESGSDEYDSEHYYLGVCLDQGRLFRKKYTSEQQRLQCLDSVKQVMDDEDDDGEDRDPIVAYNSSVDTSLVNRRRGGAGCSASAYSNVSSASADGGVVGRVHLRQRQVNSSSSSAFASAAGVTDQEEKNPSLSPIAAALVSEVDSPLFTGSSFSAGAGAGSSSTSIYSSSNIRHRKLHQQQQQQEQGKWVWRNADYPIDKDDGAVESFILTQSDSSSTTSSNDYSATGAGGKRDTLSLDTDVHAQILAGRLALTNHITYSTKSNYNSASSTSSLILSPRRVSTSTSTTETYGFNGSTLDGDGKQKRLASVGVSTDSSSSSMKNSNSYSPSNRLLASRHSSWASSVDKDPSPEYDDIIRSSHHHSGGSGSGSSGGGITSSFQDRSMAWSSSSSFSSSMKDALKRLSSLSSSSSVATGANSIAVGTSSSSASSASAKKKEEEEKKSKAAAAALLKDAPVVNGQVLTFLTGIVPTVKKEGLNPTSGGGGGGSSVAGKKKKNKNRKAATKKKKAATADEASLSKYAPLPQEDEDDENDDDEVKSGKNVVAAVIPVTAADSEDGDDEEPTSAIVVSGVHDLSSFSAAVSSKPSTTVIPTTATLSAANTSTKLSQAGNGAAASINVAATIAGFSSDSTTQEYTMEFELLSEGEVMGGEGGDAEGMNGDDTVDVVEIRTGIVSAVDDVSVATMNNVITPLISKKEEQSSSGISISPASTSASTIATITAKTTTATAAVSGGGVLGFDHDLALAIKESEPYQSVVSRKKGRAKSGKQQLQQQYSISGQPFVSSPAVVSNQAGLQHGVEKKRGSTTISKSSTCSSSSVSEGASSSTLKALITPSTATTTTVKPVQLGRAASMDNMKRTSAGVSYTLTKKENRASVSSLPLTEPSKTSSNVSSNSSSNATLAARSGRASSSSSSSTATPIATGKMSAQRAASLASSSSSFVTASGSLSSSSSMVAAENSGASTALTSSIVWGSLDPSSTPSIATPTIASLSREGSSGPVTGLAAAAGAVCLGGKGVQDEWPLPACDNSGAPILWGHHQEAGEKEELNEEKEEKKKNGDIVSAAAATAIPSSYTHPPRAPVSPAPTPSSSTPPPPARSQELPHDHHQQLHLHPSPSAHLVSQPYLPVYPHNTTIPITPHMYLPPPHQPPPSLPIHPLHLQHAHPSVHHHQHNHPSPMIPLYSMQTIGYLPDGTPVMIPQPGAAPTLSPMAHSHHQQPPPPPHMLVNISMGGGGTGDAAAAAAGVNGDVLPHHVHFIPQYPHPTAHPYHIPVAAEPSKVDGLGGGEVVVVDPSPPSAAKSPAEIKEILESLTRNGAQLQHQQKSNTVATGIQSEKIESFFRKRWNDALGHSETFVHVNEN